MPEQSTAPVEFDENYHNCSNFISVDWFGTTLRYCVYDYVNADVFCTGQLFFLPRDAMLTRVIAMGLCLSVCHHAGIVSKRLHGSSFFACSVFLDLSCTVF